MNDYKELIEKFRAKKNDGWQKDGSYQMQIITVQDILDAADAIEQLGRDNAVLTKERDAAVDDIPHNCTYCKHRKDHDWCERGHRWEWRGIMEAEHE